MWAVDCGVFFSCVNLVRSEDNQKLSRDNPPICVQSQSHILWIPPFHHAACLLLWFSRCIYSTWHICGQSIVEMTLSQEPNPACFAAELSTLAGSRLPLPNRAAFPHKLSPIPRACHYKMWPRCLTVSGDLSGSASHGSKPNSRAWI